ncbi:MAG: phage holin family protein [Kiloniellales bacterium]|jgi:uncharacterized membrane protein|nr:phage holin family protein [Kiloniellales bacterium]
MTNNDSSLRTLLKELIDEVSQLIRQEFRLAQAESAEKIGQVQSGLISIVAGLLLAFAALLILLQALVIALANVVAPWLASVIVGVVVAATSFVFVKQGQSSLKVVNLLPARTVKSVRDDKDMVMEKVR